MAINLENTFYIVKNDYLYIFFHLQDSYQEMPQSRMNIVTDLSLKSFCDLSDNDFLTLDHNFLLQQVSRTNIDVFNQYPNHHLFIDQFGNFYIYN